MCRELISWVLVFVFCVTSSSYAATIIWVSDAYDDNSDGAPDDQPWLDLLVANGYIVDLSFTNRQGRTLDANKIAALNAADLVIVSRNTDSGSYDDGDEPTQWNSITKPLILLPAHIYRSSRWRWMNSTSTTSVVENMLAVLPNHPIFAGVTLDANNEVSVVNATCSVGDNNVDPTNSYTLIATRAGGGADGVWIATWEAAVEFYPGSGQFAGGPRMYFAAGTQEGGGLGRGEYNLTAEGEKLFLNAVIYMLGESRDPAMAQKPSPRNEATDIQPTVTLSWTAGEKTASHNIYLSESFDDVNDGAVAIGSQTGTTYAPSSLELSKTYFWRIDEVHTDATVTKGKVWSFTVADYLLVDDFEDYNDQTNLIYLTWIDGYGSPAQGIPGNGTGSTVGNTYSPYAEQTIVHGGTQSMPLAYNNSGPAKLSEAIAEVDDLKSRRDWTRLGLKALSLWFRGYPAYVGSFVEGPVGTYTVTGGGADIWGNSDQFHFAFKELSGTGTIIAKVQSLSDTNEWSKAGVMIRDSLDPNSANAAVLITPVHGVRFQYRNGAADVTDRLFADGITAPQWVKIERTIGGLVKGSYSADGVTWVQFDLLDKVIMNLPVYIGLAVTSHDVDAACVARFSDVSFPGTSVGAQWAHQDIGITSNEAQPMYVAISNANGTPAVVYHEDPNATLISTWTEWNISLKEFSNQGVNLADVDKVVIGFGDKRNPRPGGAGKMYFDDIRLYPPRCLPGLLKPAGDLTNDCKVDYSDIELVVNNWLINEYDVTPTVPSDSNLVARYQFENNANDSIGGRHGQVNGNPAYAAGAVGNWAIDLDGTEDYVRCPNDVAFEITGQITVAAWIRIAAFDTTWQAIVTKGDDSWRLHRWSSNNSLSWNCNGVTGGTLRGHSTDIGIDDGQWHHVAGVYDGSKMYLYVDGMLDNSQGASGSINVGAYPVMIGENAQQIGREWNGLIDDVRIYSRALSHAEIASLAGKTQKFTQLLETLLSPRDPAVDMYGDRVIDLKDFAQLADSWLEHLLWPQP